MPWSKIEISTYWLVFVTSFLAAAIWESVAPRRRLVASAERRWTRHAVLLAVSLIAQSFILRISPVMVAVITTERAFGLLQRMRLPAVISFAVAILLLDLGRYVTHRVFHSVRVLWRVHEVHHSDPEYDVSTAGRFHPIEVIVGQAAYLGTVAVLGPPVVAVLTAELLSVPTNFFGHMNAALRGPAEKLLRTVFITPDLHRIHHSEEIAEQSANFGQTFVFWDRLFGTYTAEPQAGNGGLITGVRGLQNATSLDLKFMLLQPFGSWLQKETGSAVTPGPQPK